MKIMSTSSLQFSTTLLLLLLTPLPVMGLDKITVRNYWLFEIASLIPGLVLVFLYTHIIKKNPGQNLVLLLRRNFGVAVGNLLAGTYVIYFLLLASKTLVQFGNYMVNDLLNETPQVVIMTLFIILVCYGVYTGIEAIARSSIVFIIVSSLSIAAIMFFVNVMGGADYNRLLPVMENGAYAIVNRDFLVRALSRHEWLIALLFIVFDATSTKKTLYIASGALVVAAIVRAYISLMGVAVLGDAALMNSSNYLSILSESIDIGVIFQRVDGIAFIYIMLPMFIEVSVTFYAVLRIFSLMVNTGKEKRYVVFGAIALTLTSIFLSENMAIDSLLNESTPHDIVQLVMVVGIPLLLLLTTLAGRYRRNAE